MSVLIAGAGPTGLTLAIDLARRGIAVRLIDKATEYFNGSRGDGLQPRTLEVFEDLGVLDEVLAQGRSMPLMKIYLDGTLAMERRMAEPVEPTPDVPYPNAWMLGQSRTEKILRDKLAEYGVRVELNTEIVGFTQNADAVTAELSTGETVDVDYLVGADGGRSFVRKHLGIAFEGTTDESIRTLLGDVAADGLDHEYGYWFASKGNPMAGIAMTPLSGGDQFQFGAPLDGEDADTSIEGLQELVDKYAGPGVAKLRDLTWSTVWRPNVRLAERFRVGRVFIAGDAAHVHPPTGGQGLNTGVQDAYNLGWKLADGREEVLATYESERHTNAARVLGISEELMQKHVDGDESAMERGENTRQLDVSYRDLSDTRPIAPGDRAPDAPLVDAAGNNLRLFDFFRGPHFTLLRFNPTTPSTGDHTIDVVRRDASDGTCASPEAFAHYHASDGAEILIRPDGYLA
ncbi:2-polyprenyl-6-methoxyphenol hydroxylase-like FAD-dependent oxidoreductase [Kribbella antiqua]|uniref:2-polyprenyl-6-methoxyphenol hydroxylase-like FAD-dependent oxidoreductase n=1 Tax=Kribbella antiqua TaxID=2512217 RepID=A0A4R2INL2_9ACTN|nr:FAD-dependent monooxygenase [Kribbella antiqua]TCO45579.1 2-polyprenyl-6-methoxyphenol hydroxylase-like FAD-dependent oxidoreductase [Kribbella antiqua]